MPDIIECGNCGKETYAVLEVCPHCGKPTQAETNAKRQIEKAKRHIDEAKSSGEWSKIPTQSIADLAAHITLTTSYYIANRKVDREIEIITAECVFGMNIFRDFFAGVRDIVGGRSVATQTVLRDARTTVLTELRREALMVGGDAVISVDMAYSEFSGGGEL